MTPALALMMGLRGRDSWGVTDGDFIHKQKGDIADTFVDLELDSPLYHTRQASVGIVSDRNAHPFLVESPTKVIVGVHNGHIGNYDSLKTKYGRTDCQVDSEQIFHHLAYGEDLAEIGGWGAVVWYEYPPGHPEERVRYFSRFGGDNLHFVKLKTGEIAFASTETSLVTAARLANAEIETIYKTDQKKRYWIDSDGNLMYATEELNWGAHPYTAPLPVTTWRGANGGDNYSRSGYGRNFVNAGGSGNADTGHRRYAKDECALKNCASKIKPAEELVCSYCFRMAVGEIYGGTDDKDSRIFVG